MVEISAPAFLIMLSIKWALKKKNKKKNRQIDIKLFCVTNDLNFFFQIISIRQWFKNDSM